MLKIHIPIHIHIHILGNYQYLFDGCCRGKATNWKNQGDMSHSDCASKCDRKSDCIAIETNGWNEESGQHGPCWLFEDSGETEITNGKCNIDGDTKCFEKIKQGGNKYLLTYITISSSISHT